MAKFFVFNGKRGQKEYYQVYAKGDKRTLYLKCKEETKTIFYRFFKTKEYNKHSKWNEKLCEKLECDILNGLIRYKKEVVEANPPIFIVSAKHFSDGKDYYWVARRAVAKKLKAGDCIIVETYRGEKLAFVMNVFKFDKKKNEKPTRKVIRKFNKELPFVTKEEYLIRKSREIQ